MSECSCKWWSSTTLRTRGRSRKMAVFRVSLVHEGGKSLLHPSVILNLTALRVPRAEMLWCGCPHRALPNVTPVRSTIPLTLELFSTFAHRSAALRANQLRMSEMMSSVVGNIVCGICWVFNRVCNDLRLAHNRRSMLSGWVFGVDQCHHLGGTDAPLSG